MSIQVALAGNPNCGKTTLFNGLTGATQYVGNWQGVTVEKKEGKYKEDKDIKIKHYKEPVKVVKNYEEIKAAVQVEKLAMGFKMEKASFPIRDKVILDLYLNMIVSLCFGSSSEFREMIRKRHLIC